MLLIAMCCLVQSAPEAATRLRELSKK